MAITTTPNLGLLKPDATEIARFWANPDDDPESPVASINNGIIDDVARTSIEFQEFTPVLQATTTNPSLGTGPVVKRFGRYRVIGDLVLLQVLIRFGGSGTSAGSGTYFVEAPTVISPNHVVSTLAGSGDVVGEGHLRDNGTTASSQTCSVFIATTNRFRFTSDNSGTVTDSVPFIWGAGDSLGFSCVYEYGGEL